MSTISSKASHTCMISGLWLHRVIPEEHRRRVVEVWKKLFATKDMGGDSAHRCGVVLLMEGKLHRLVFDGTPSDALQDNRLADMLHRFIASQGGPSAILAASGVDGVIRFFGGEHTYPLISGNIALVHDGRIEVKGDKDPKGDKAKHAASATVHKTPSKSGPFGTSNLLKAIDTTGVGKAKGKRGLSTWRDALKGVEGCSTCVVLNTDGEFYLCADSPNDIHLAIAPRLSEAVFFSTEWDALRDQAACDETRYMGGFFKETVRRDEVIGVVLSKGQLAHGIPGYGDRSGSIGWCHK